MERMSPQMKLIGLVNLIILFHLAPSRMLYDKYFSSYEFFNLFLQKIQIEFFSIFLRFCEGSIKKCTDVCLSTQIQENMFLSVAAHR